ncbi:unnamed protein product [Vitrella brassicaformis CCMP3155]|uniref:Transcription and mRNA export factor ENY2 n=1 Tax=Vitrella brassicaformis (strain CCMP3155) TaxID=1169540 RepID=A0A0G4FH53_VITBC|nr:unnamed protein product [Vitrella brassicaformis CCMP3155]|eukprot:CEM12747.1 unnamed protein product [Vitrella brassicaformis CCMP3155]
MANERRSQLEEDLAKSGEETRLKEWLRTELAHCGWREEVKRNCLERIRNMGMDKVSVEDLIKQVQPYGRQTVPDEVKAELINKLRAFAEFRRGQNVPPAVTPQ